METQRQCNGLSAKMETNSDQNGVIQPLLTGKNLNYVLLIVTLVELSFEFKVSGILLTEHPVSSFLWNQHI